MFSVEYDLAVNLLFEQLDVPKIIHSDEVLALKTRLLLKALWLLTFLFFSILSSSQPPELGAMVLSLSQPSLNPSLGLVRQLMPTRRHEKYDIGGIISDEARLLFSSLWELFVELGVA